MESHYVQKFLNIKFQDGDQDKRGHNGVGVLDVMKVVMNHLDGHQQEETDGRRHVLEAIVDFHVGIKKLKKAGFHELSGS